MPHQYLLLVLGSQHVLVNAGDKDPLSQLNNLCLENNIPVKYLESQIDFSSVRSQLDDFQKSSIQQSIIVCGRSAPDKIIEICKILRECGHEVIVATDSLAITTDGPAIITNSLTAATESLNRKDESLFAVCVVLENLGCQLSRAQAILSLLNGQTRFIYAYPKADIAASIAVFFARSKSVLLIKRKFEPFKGMLALPGGFLRPLLEDLPSCAARELFEETGLKVNPGDLNFVNVRSNPDRDSRGHVIDHGYCVVIGSQKEEAFVKTLFAQDDAEEVCLIPVELALHLSLAADHNLLLNDAWQTVRNNHSKQPALSWTEQNFLAHTDDEHYPYQQYIQGLMRFLQTVNTATPQTMIVMSLQRISAVALRTMNALISNFGKFTASVLNRT